MKKKIILGKTSWIYMFAFLIVGMLIFFIVFTIIKKPIISINELISAIVFTIVAAIIGFSFEQGFNAFIEISEDKIVLKTFFCEKKYIIKTIL